MCYDINKPMICTSDAPLRVTVWLHKKGKNIKSIKKFGSVRGNKQRKMATWKNCVTEDDPNFNIMDDI